MLHTCPLALLLLATLWTATEFESASQPVIDSAGPEWRRTSEGWVKVGIAGAAGLAVADPKPVQDPALHPGAVAAFMLLGGLLSLAAFDCTSQGSSHRDVAAAAIASPQTRSEN